MCTCLFDNTVSIATSLESTVAWHSTLIQREGQVEGFDADVTIMESPLTQLLGKVVENLDVVLNICSIVFRDNGNATKWLALDNVLGFVVAELRCGPG